MTKTTITRTLQVQAFRNSKHDLVLVALKPDQIALAKATNGKRKRITHALICGPYGQMFGTEKQCRKYFWAWDPHKGGVFPKLFGRAVESNDYEILHFKSTPNLVLKLIDAEG